MIATLFGNWLSRPVSASAHQARLVLRDRGYFTIQAIDEHKRAGADTISRYKHYTALYDRDRGQKINLLALLTQNGSVDMVVDAGSEQKVQLRLIAVPAPEETANVRRMKAKKEMNGHAPSQELLQLMSWTIFLTTIGDLSITFKEIFALYGLRCGSKTFSKPGKATSTSPKSIPCLRSNFAFTVLFKALSKDK